MKTKIGYPVQFSNGLNVPLPHQMRSISRNFFTPQTRMTSGGRYMWAHDELCVNVLWRMMSMLCNMTQHGTAKFNKGEIETN